MQVTNIRVSFLREKQPVQYEKAVPAVEFTATLDDGEDHAIIARQMMTDATAVVYAGIGYAVPAKVAKALADGNVPAEVTVEAKTETATEKPAETVSEPIEEPAKAGKKRGRPVGSKNTAPKAGTKAAEKKAAEGLASTAAAQADDGLPPEDEKPNISSGEERVDPADDGIPGEETSPTSNGEVDFSSKDLHDMIMTAIKDKKLSGSQAKSVLARFRVARARDLTPEDVVKARDMVTQMIEAIA